MKKIFVTLSLMVVTMMVMAVPAKRGVWKTLLLENGTELRAQLVGDEHGHFWRATDGKAYLMDAEGVAREIDSNTIVVKAKTRRQQVNTQRAQRLKSRRIGAVGCYEGKKKAIVLLVNFSDKKFATAHDNALFNRIANEEGYSEGSFRGSMADYFKAQSRGLFELDFDVVGPLTVSQKQSYYGGNDKDGNDKYPGQMVCEAVTLAKQQVSDWKQYDWDNDGYVDQVYVVYAGQGEADGGSDDTIWPHAYDLTSAKSYGDGSGPVTVGTNLKVNSYACGSELNGYNKIEGIGVMCHEYSHCLGYPDFYDIDYSGGQGMGPWDLMDSGSYNDDGYQPAGYTSYERWMAGWVTPIELDAESVTVENMKSLQNDGECYIIYNKGNRDEFMLLENRQLEGWDKSLPSAGLLILHCDYNQSVWEANGPNDDPNHQRMTVVPADGKYTRKYNYTYQQYYYEEADIAKDPFPQGTVKAFNKDFKTSDNIAKRAAQFFTKNTNGTYWIDGSIEQITQNSNKTVSFNYVAAGSSSVEPGGDEPGGDDPVVNPDGALFYESFDNCTGSGGNDDKWGSTVANGAFRADNDDWEAVASYGGKKCARFGSSRKSGEAKTPVINLPSEAVLTFKAAAWGSDGKTLKLSAEGATVVFSPAQVTMESSEWTTFTVKTTGKGSARIVFTPSKRFFLDEVTITDPNATTAVRTIATPRTTSGRIYTLDGRYVGTNPNQLPHGLYVIDGKKVIR